MPRPSAAEPSRRLPRRPGSAFVRLGAGAVALALAAAAAAPTPAAAAAPAASAPAAPASSDRTQETGSKDKLPPSPDHPFNLPVAARTDAYGPRPPGVPRLTRDQIVQYGLQNPLVKAADAQIEQMEATLLRAKFSWIPAIRTTTALAPGVYTRCEDIQLQTDDPARPLDFQYCRPAGEDGVDVDTIKGYFAQLKQAGVAFRFSTDFVIPIFTSGKIKHGKAMA
ncbi:MAG TPA: hypothetical protein VIK91_19075, partial [Nannocystis sp.]